MSESAHVLVCLHYQRLGCSTPFIYAAANYSTLSLPL